MYYLFQNWDIFLLFLSYVLWIGMIKQQNYTCDILLIKFSLMKKDMHIEYLLHIHFGDLTCYYFFLFWISIEKNLFGHFFPFT